MALSPFAWLLPLVAFCHLFTLLAGQHLGVTKCKIICQKMTSPIPVTLLIHYQLNQESCGRAIVLETRQHRNFCADPKEKWVQDAMKYLDHKAAAALTQNSGKFEKLVNVTPGITLSTRGLSPSALAEPEATVKSLTLELTTISKEAQRPMGTSQEPPAAVTESASSTSKARDAGLAARPQSTGIFEEAPISTTTWQSPAASQSESGLQAEKKATEPTSTTASSTEAPTTLHSTPEESVGSESQSPWVQGQSPSLEKSLVPKETNQTHTDDFQDRGPGNTVHPSVAPISSEGTPSQELVTSGSWPPKAEEPIHATPDTQKLSVFITPVPDSQAATRRQAVGLLAFLGLLFCLGVAMFAYQSLQGCPRKMAGEVVEGLRYVPRSCGSNSYVLVPV
ncbi:fractalkine [Sigmodon hispidus]